jgi:hypothetical protein
MNDFEGVNTGHWLVNSLDFNMYDAQCSFCGYHIPIAVELDFGTFKPELRGLREHCPRCNKNMFQEELKLLTKEAAFAVGQLEPSSKSLVINCEKISLEQKSLGIVIDISESIDNIDTVEINGTRFVREVK